ncbi:MAG: GTP 3',8-cyclase MoaA [Actinomyces sp.]|uniref:GTP 3',8-cyclase MoaA n=1 Tax=Actinomyces sp. TaxID=29317 RepID=UPI0026DB38DC|nr:GTP 3',8-cyclase MoaA [Actinomyces sp.]MDO4242305.1 GTP 3',8-cyclase MoaA [Actinomyces sp.]
MTPTALEAPAVHVHGGAASHQPAHGTTTGLVDRFGRTVRDLRLAVTDRCNLRCTYCMPAHGMQWLPSSQLLTGQEIARLARIGVERLGIERIRLTGGEPLLRRDLEEVIALLAVLRVRRTGAKPDIGLTTNGLGLAVRAPALRAAGLDRVNISIDALDASAYASVTRRDRLDAAVAGASAARAAGLSPVKINAVALPDTVQRAAPHLLAECLRRGWHLRFIEHMPLGPPDSWSIDEVVSGPQIIDVLTRAGFELTDSGRKDRRPARHWQVAAGTDSQGRHYPAGDVGIIASVTAPFCHDCDRTRVTADGRLMTCLFSPAHTDLRTALRTGADDEEVARLWAGATWDKPLGHGADDPAPAADRFARPGRTMSAIGG